MYGFDDMILSQIFFSTVKYVEYKNNISTNIKKKIFHSNSDNAVFILPQWMGKTFYFKPLINKLKSGNTVVLYELPYNLLSDNIKLTANSFKDIADDMHLTFDGLQNQGHKTYSIVATSTSCVLAVMAANSDTRCKKIILNLVGNDLAECMWNSKNPLLIHHKNNLIRDNISLQKLKNYFKPMSYEKNSSNLRNKKILIFLSKNDKIVPYKNGVKLINHLDRDGIDYKIITNNFFGHYISGVKNVIFNDKIIKFLEK